MNARTGLGRTTTALLLATIAAGLLHHIDHVLRVDHSGWPFRPNVTPFSYSLIAYPVLLWALFGSRRWFWPRWAALLLGTGLTIVAHTMIETPQMQYAMWAYNQSLEPALWNVRNLCGVKSGPLGMMAVVVSMALNVLLVTVTVAMFADGRRLQRAR